jgi:hypothetical protein
MNTMLATSPVDVQEHLLLTTVRIAQVAKNFEVGMLAGDHEHQTEAMYWNAYYQLTILFGFSGQGPAKIAAESKLCRLGLEMDAAWQACNVADRSELAALPWVNDGEPAEIGVWEKETDDASEHGKAIVRAPLRQHVPPELGYIADDWRASLAATGDDTFDCGRKYCEEYLLPESKRVLPILQAGLEKVTRDMGTGQVFVPPLKTTRRMDEKCGNIAGSEADHMFTEFPRQACNVDVARVMLELSEPQEVIHAHHMISEQMTVVRVKNRFSPDNPLYGYRDMLLNVEIDGVFAECQIGITPLIVVRRKMHKWYGLVRSNGFRSYVSLAKPFAPKGDFQLPAALTPDLLLTPPLHSPTPPLCTAEVGAALAEKAHRAMAAFEAELEKERQRQSSSRDLFAIDTGRSRRCSSSAATAADWSCDMCNGSNGPHKRICG